MGGWNIFFALINFAILALALYLVGKKLVAKLLHDNRQKIIDSLAQAEQAKSKTTALSDELAKLSAQSGDECHDILLSAQNQLTLNKRQLEAKSTELSHEEAVREQRELENLTQSLLGELKSENTDALLSGVAARLAAEDNATARAALEARFAEGVQPLLQFTQADNSLLWWGGKVTVTLTGSGEEALKSAAGVQQAVETALGAENISFSTAIDPSLIGGFRLSVGDTVYDGSLDNMLKRLREDIAGDKAVPQDLPGYYSSKFSAADKSIARFQIGTVVSLSECICRISGLSDVMAGEMVRLDGGVRAMVMDIDANQVSAVLLDSSEAIHSGSLVRRTGKVMEVPVGEALVGRVVDGLGNPIDGKGELAAVATRPVENIAPGILSRQPVSVPLQTGIMAIDALVPIGRGQRELIIGDRQTGKTSIAIDTVINQKGKGVICIYVAIGQKESTVAAIVEKLRELGAMDYSIVVDANASDPAPMLYLAPYTGAAMGEYLMNKGKHVLIIYDDLSKHAVAYRELSLLLHRPPGREAYPGDVFYLHSRLLERAACLSEEKGGGSMTALPIVETQAGDISAYIPTNVISITDGQIFLDEGMFNSGNRPAINAGLSVSRVGGAAQPKAMKQFASRLRMDLAQHRELEAFAQFGSDLDKATRDALNRGRKITRLMVQKRYSPQTTAAQVVAIFAANEGYLDDLDTGLISRFQEELSLWVYDKDPELCRHIDEGGKLSDQQIEKLRSLISGFKSEFIGS